MFCMDKRTKNREIPLSVRTDTILDELLELACASIKYRLCVELLGQPPESTAMLELQDQILLDPAVQAVLRWQGPDGWLAWGFHGAKSHETGMRILCEKGLSTHHPALIQALQALEKYPDRLERGFGKPGQMLDQLGFGGKWMAQATLFAYAGAEDKLFMRDQIQAALTGFQAVLEVDSIEDIVEPYQDRLVFKPGIRWPGIYHLRLLAFTRGWRTYENHSMLVKSVRRLMELSPIPEIYVRSKSRWIAPAAFGMHDFNPQMDYMDAAHWMIWFHRTECLARLGVIQSIPALKQSIDRLADLSRTVPGWFPNKLNHPYFSRWGAYTGLMLEPNWRQSKSREYDLNFRRLLILHYGS
jgi:hypothetical protein